MPPSLASELEAQARAVEAKAAADAAELRRLASLAAADDAPSRWVDVAAYLASAVSRKVALNACRAGAIEGASKVGKRWVARARDIDAWVAKTSPAPAETADALLASWMSAAHS